MPLDPVARAQATDRVAARVLVVDREGAVLLFRGCDLTRPEAGTWWFTPGGGVGEAETIESAVRRELFEETGLAVDDVGPVLFERDTVFDFESDRYRQHEYFFLVRTERFELDDRGWSEVERRSVLEYRWWSPTEIDATDETIYPEALAQTLDDLLHGG